jgi:NitT/TauT family transport system substrate-binding protein
MSRSSIKIAALAGFAVVAALGSMPAPAAELKAWHHGILEAKSDAGFVMMVTKGFAEQQGLKLDLVQFKSEIVAARALLAGELDSYDASPTGAMIAASRGADIKIIGCFWPGVPHAIFVRGAINSPGDLKGKTIAISSPGALPDLLVRTLLHQNQIAPADVTFANLGADTDRFKALAAGVVDAAETTTEYAPIAEQQKLRILVHAADVLPNYMRLCFASSGKTLSTRPDDAMRFLAAEMSALRHALAHREETIALTRAITGEKADDPRAAFVFDETVRTRGVDPTLAIPLDRLRFIQELSVSSGVQPRLVDLGQAVDPRPRDQALKLVGQ